ncbi:DUF4224 domain-containing protein [Mycetohabitans sp. B8]|uniref:DUF4224 domain-containing protein n=1 Tax=Mycetohabitans sp. B8 TaxID=2841845 RepID=UPI001F3DDD4A|nr:DUF4224 domain-containing protein [Mycetohabitans sp. B8]MCG1042536.1 DUF4224 domain-containing protein [Mycetohabitans sp. B8]
MNAQVTNAELIQVTGGLKQGAAQARWIERELGFRPPMKADGHPLLTWDQVNRTPTEPSRKTQPKWKVAA